MDNKKFNQIKDRLNLYATFHPDEYIAIGINEGNISFCEIGGFEYPITIPHNFTGLIGTIYSYSTKYIKTLTIEYYNFGMDNYINGQFATDLQFYKRFKDNEYVQFFAMLWTKIEDGEIF